VPDEQAEANDAGPHLRHQWGADVTGAASVVGWPLSSVMPLEARPSAAKVARGYIRTILNGWCMSHLADDAEIVLSELVANAINASGAPSPAMPWLLKVRVCLFTDGMRFRVEVWDQAPGIPAVRPTGSDAESGRGLEMVEAIATDWGWFPAFTGKCVWAEMTVLSVMKVRKHPRSGPAPDCRRGRSGRSSRDTALAS
jgi:anti-sigma regulatory factor (Ser/Thr protein kinase)